MKDKFKQISYKELFAKIESEGYVGQIFNKKKIIQEFIFAD